LKTTRNLKLTNSIVETKEFTLQPKIRKDPKRS